MRWLAAMAMALSMGAGPVAAQVARDGTFSTAAVTPPPAGVKIKPVALTKLGSSLRENQGVGNYMYGAICVQPERIYWSDVVKSLGDLKAIFADELKAAGFQPDRDPSNLFADQEAPSADLQVGALIKAIDIAYCETVITKSGKVAMDIQWQVYSNIRREVVATIETRGTVQRAERSKAPRSLADEGFATNVRALLSDERFRALVLAGSQQPVAPAASAPIAMRLAPTGAPVKVAEAANSVVAIFAGGGHGSGFLISPEGYVLTNSHVVGSAEEVRVRWADRSESIGRVVRSDRRRDVALVKVEPGARRPMVLRASSLDLGAPVLAIGTPLDPTLQNTITRGIVSAERVLEGQPFIQSDVAIIQGNSGGPLIDDAGRVVGISVLARQINGASVGLNFFIPIEDALRALQIRPAP